MAPRRALPRNLLEMQILGSYCRPTESEALGVRPSNLFLIKLPSDPDTCSHLRSSVLGLRK